MMCSYETKIIGGKLCMFEKSTSRWVQVTASDIFRAGTAFRQRGSFPPIKFN